MAKRGPEPPSPDGAKLSKILSTMLCHPSSDAVARCPSPRANVVWAPHMCTCIFSTLERSREASANRDSETHTATGTTVGKCLSFSQTPTFVDACCSCTQEKVHVDRWEGDCEVRDASLTHGNFMVDRRCARIHEHPLG
jgi:hypothetical protein